jgi:hypothetical protein
MPRLTGTETLRRAVAVIVTACAIAAADEADTDPVETPAVDALDDEPDLDEQPDLEEEPPSPPEDSGSIFQRIWSDPRLGGKLHFTLRQDYVFRYHDFKEYRFPFPDTVTEDDLEQARQLERRRENNKADQDLATYFSLRLDDIYAPEEPLGPLDSAGGEVSFRYTKDIDGSPQGEESQGIHDNVSDRDTFQLQTMFARLRTFEKHLELELGRQFAHEAEWLHFDGGYATFRGLRVLDRDVELAAFGGSRVKYYPRRSSSHDGAGGGHIRAWLSETTRLELSDVYYVENTFEAELRKDIVPGVWVAGRYRMINEFPHSVLLDGVYEPDPGLQVYLFYVGKLGRGTDDFDFDFTQSQRRRKDLDVVRHFNIGDIEPYDEVSLEARKGFEDQFGVFAGGIIHGLRERDAENEYNTDWQEVWAGLDATHLVWEGLTGRATVRYIHTDLPRRRLRLPVDEVLTNGLPDFLPEDVQGDGEPSSLGLELLLEQDFQRVVAVGATAVLRAYDYRSNYANLENLQFASLGAHARWRVGPGVQLLLSYFYDEDYELVNPDLDSTHTVRTQVLITW